MEYTKEDIISIGRDFLNSMQTDMLNMHGIEGGIDTANDEICHQAGESQIADCTKMKAQQEAYEKQQAEQYEQMDEVDRAYYKASIDHASKWMGNSG